MRWPCLFALLLVGCGQSPREKAQADVDFLEAHGGTPQERCEAYTRLVEADLAEHDSANWDTDRRMQRDVCIVASA
jgi:hypothetical protein